MNGDGKLDLVVSVESTNSTDAILFVGYLDPGKRLDQIIRLLAETRR